MSLTPIAIIKAKVKGMRDAISKQSDRTKVEYISSQLAKDYNDILARVKNEHPPLESVLPPIIQPESPDLRRSRERLSDTKYIDLEVRLGCLVELLEVAEHDD